MDIEEVYLLDDQVWLICLYEEGLRLYVAGHRSTPKLVTKLMVERGDVPQEVIEWYKSE